MSTIARNIDILEDIDLYGRIEKRSWKNVTLSTSAKMRLASIAGHIWGLRHAGHEELADRMAEDFNKNLGYLMLDDRKEEIELKDVEEIVSVPARKLELFDDGTFHGFAFVAYAPVDPEVYDLVFEKYKEARPDCYQEQLHKMTLQDLNVNDALTITHWCTAASCERKIYYRRSFNGGLIYHGPGAGETFSVLVGSKDTFWSIHT